MARPRAEWRQDRRDAAKDAEVERSDDDSDEPLIVPVSRVL